MSSIQNKSTDMDEQDVLPRNGVEDHDDARNENDALSSPSYSIEYEPMSCSQQQQQQQQETEVIIPLPDGFDCVVQLDRCSLDTASNAPMLTSLVDVECPRRGEKEEEEEEKALNDQSDSAPLSYIGVPEGEDPEYYFETLPMEDFNFLEIYINLDIPRRSRPPSPEDEHPQDTNTVL